MRTLLISDTHFGNHPDFADYKDGLNSRFLLQLSAIRQALKWGLKNDCTEILHLGDVFHQRGYIEPEIFNPVKELFESFLRKGMYSDMEILTGNHDITTEDPIYNTAYMLSGPSIRVITIPFLRDKCLYVPFTKGDFGEIIKSFDHDEIRTLFMHQSIFGAEYGRPILKGVHPKLLKGIKRVYCGHIHQPQKIGLNIHLVGAPYQINFGDTGDRTVYILEDNKIVDKMTPKHPFFITQHAKDGRVPVLSDDWNFYRILSDVLIENAPSNMRVVFQPKVKKIVRVRAKNDNELLKAYCKRLDRSDMYEIGVKLLTERLPK